MPKVLGLKLTDADHARFESAAGSEGLTKWARRVLDEAAQKVNPPKVKVNLVDFGVETQSAGGQTVTLSQKINASIRGGSLGNVKSRELLDNVKAVGSTGREPKIPEGHSPKCTCLKCQKAKGWRG